jgi:hypothetical protein
MALLLYFNNEKYSVGYKIELVGYNTNNVIVFKSVGLGSSSNSLKISILVIRTIGNNVSIIAGKC